MNLKFLILEELEELENFDKFEKLYNFIKKLTPKQFSIYLKKLFPDEDHPDWFTVDFEEFLQNKKSEMFIKYLNDSELVAYWYGDIIPASELFRDLSKELFKKEIFMYSDTRLGIYGNLKKKQKKGKIKKDTDIFSISSKYDGLNWSKSYLDASNIYTWAKLTPIEMLNLFKQYCYDVYYEGFQGIKRDQEKNIIGLQSPDYKQNLLKNINKNQNIFDNSKQEYDNLINKLIEKYPNIKAIPFLDFLKNDFGVGIEDFYRTFSRDKKMRSMIVSVYKNHPDMLEKAKKDKNINSFFADNIDNIEDVFLNLTKKFYKIYSAAKKVYYNFENDIESVANLMRDEKDIGSFDASSYLKYIPIEDRSNKDDSNIIMNMINHFSKTPDIIETETDDDDDDRYAEEEDDTVADYHATRHYFGREDTQENWEDYLDWRANGYKDVPQKGYKERTPYQKWWEKKYGSRNNTRSDWNNWYDSSSYGSKKFGFDNDARERIEKDKINRSITTINKFIDTARLVKIDQNVINSLEKILSDSDINNPKPELKKLIKKVYRQIVNKLHPDKQLTPEEKAKSEEAFKSFTNDIYDRLPNILKESISFKKYFYKNLQL